MDGGIPRNRPSDPTMPEMRERAMKLAFLVENNATGSKLDALVALATKRMQAVEDAPSLGDNWLGRRARANTPKTLLDAEARLDREIEKMLDQSGLRKRWEESSAPGLADPETLAGSLNAPLFATGRDSYVAAAERLFADVDHLPAIADEAWALIGSILRGCKFPADDVSYQQMAGVAFLLFFAETWDEVEVAQVERLLDTGLAAFSAQRRAAGKRTAEDSTPAELLLTVPMWWATDATGTFVALRSYIESQESYQRLLALKPVFYDESKTDDAGRRNIEVVWNTGIACAFAWMFMRHA